MAYRFEHLRSIDGVWTLDLLKRQNRLHLDNPVSPETQREIEDELNTEIAEKAKSDVDWMVNWSNCHVYILADETGWCVIVDEPRRNIHLSIDSENSRGRG